ncbi:RagB/SusD family nutrient uptake outer membrane protein [Ilyomonas limi]|uniref:RagB/SusD family nutrient uptake outer membrane protein n=1 Tax=Ilyomonas limi TaxID=2575867 RepID=A0A4U3L7D5_9BACT|nr:RagB/SusD family nutrient uptake outer membrane protein [Ilyomonas limi]TKK70970.1 RagB/SusD family nutrient uptake outer membrane protein [Ilyomonas limi]
MLNQQYRIPFFLLLLSFTVFLNACKKDFINDVAPTNSATADQVYASPDAVRVYFNGIYRSMRSQWQSIDASAGGSTDTWGYNSINLARDAKGMDIVMPYNSWYYFDYQNDNREPTYRRTRFTWYFFYELINQVNTLINGVQNSTTITEEQKAPLFAEGRALRAFLYFELIREFQFAYLKDPSAPGVPVYTEPASGENLEGKPRGTVKDVYNQINDDIQFAVQNLTTDRALKSQVNLNVAWGMAARIYLEQGKWAEAENAAINAREGLSLDASGYPDNYNGLTSDEVIWGFPQTIENGGQSLYYGTPSSFFEQTGNGYDAFWMSRELVENFSATDIRNTFYVYDPDPTAADYLATNKFGISSGQPVELISGKTVDLKTIDFNESLNMIRVGEMYLIEAEAKAKQGKDADADNILFELQSNRDPKAVQSHKTGQALIDEILLERRKELYGELGIDWLDAKRLQLPIDRTKSNHPTPNDYFIPANDPAFNLKIPQSEIQANEALSAADQNP